jgi:hypothetical protein
MLFFLRRRKPCSECGDRVIVDTGDHCGRCHRVVCRACARMRGRTHETVLCVQCAGEPKRTGLQATPVYRAWKRMKAA